MDGYRNRSASVASHKPKHRSLGPKSVLVLTRNSAPESVGDCAVARKEPVQSVKELSEPHFLPNP